MKTPPTEQLNRTDRLAPEDLCALEVLKAANGAEGLPVEWIYECVRHSVASSANETQT